MQEKLCPKCNKMKSADKFAKDKSTTTGLRSHCKICCAVYRRAYYHQNPQYHIKRVQEWRGHNLDKSRKYMDTYRKRLKSLVFQHYGAVCTCCGENEVRFLTVDHVNGGGRAHRKGIGSLGVYRDIIKKGYPDNFRILCMNCNWAIRFGDVCPHKATT